MPNVKRKNVFKAVALITTVALLVFATLLYFYPVAIGIGFMRGSMTTLGGMDRVTVQVDDTEITVFEGGPPNGQGILLIHGLQDHAGTWWRVAPHLVDRGYRVVALDLPGHGESGPEAGRLTPEMLVEAARHVLQTRFDGPVHVVGNSLGGAVAIQLVGTEPSRTSKLIVVNSAGMPVEIDQRAFLPESLDDLRKTLDQVLGPQDLPMPEFILNDIMDSIEDGATPRLWEALASADFLDQQLPEIENESHVVWGEADGLLPVELGEQMSQLLPNAYFHPIPECGHAPQVMCPSAFRAVLFEILSQGERPETD